MARRLSRWIRLGGALLLAALLLAPAARSPRPAGAAGPFAYITVGLETVDVLDTSTNSIVGTIHVAGGGIYVAVNPAGTRVYVSNSGSNTVSVVDTSTNSVITAIPVGNAPDSVAVNPAGTRVYVANINDNDVSVIDAGTNSVTAIVPVGRAPQSVAVSPTGTRVYVANYLDDSLSVIDTSTNMVAATIPLIGGPLNVAVSPDGTHLYVIYINVSDVSVIDTSTNAVVTNIATPRGAFTAAVNPDGSRVYFSDGTDRVGVIDTSTNTVAATIEVGARPSGVAVNSTGTRVYVVSQGFDDGTGSVSVIDTGTNSVTATVPLGGFPEVIGRFVGSVISNVGSSTALTATPSTVSAGKPVTLKATVSCMYIPGGSVAFAEGSSPLGSGTLTSAGVASVTTSSLLSAGPHTITASYAGDNNCNPSSSTTSVTVVVQTVTLSSATAQYSDPVTLQATVSGLTLGTLSTGGSVQFSLNGSTVGSPISLPASAVSGGQVVFQLPATATLPPGQYSLGASFTPTDTTDFDTASATLAHGLTVTAEDARVQYTGNATAWTAPSGGSATVFLSTTIKDISAMPSDPATDSFPGDIRTATVKFVDRGNGNATLCTAPVLLVSASDQKVGTVGCSASISLGSQSSLTLTVGTVVGGNYTRDSSADNATVTISKARSGAVVYANGSLQSSRTGGALAPSSGPLTTSIALLAAYPAGASSPTGSLSLTFAANGHVYRLSGSGFGGVSESGQSATVEAAGSLVDITNLLHPQLVDGAARLQLRLHAGSGPAGTVALALYRADGSLALAVSWDGSQPVPQPLLSGQVNVS